MPKEENKNKDDNKETDDNVKLAIKKDNYTKDKKPFLDQHFSEDFLNDYF